MVRKGSPVRVRQRALEKPLETAAFLVPRSTDAASTIARGPLLGRIRFVSERHGNARKGSPWLIARSGELARGPLDVLGEGAGRRLPGGASRRCRRHRRC